MSVQDPISQLITVINNAQSAYKGEVILQKSNLKMGICSILKKEGYIDSFSDFDEGSKQYIKIKLKYVDNKPAINMFKRVSKSSCRIYSKVIDFPLVMSGLGILIVSTPKGIMTSNDAKAKNIGGELLCKIF